MCRPKKIKRRNHHSLYCGRQDSNLFLLLSACFRFTRLALVFPRQGNASLCKCTHILYILYL
nr:MAG TPA: hypothetical protein [Caudoviricetes sp.]